MKPLKTFHFVPKFTHLECQWNVFLPNYIYIYIYIYIHIYIYIYIGLYALLCCFPPIFRHRHCWHLHESPPSRSPISRVPLFFVVGNCFLPVNSSYGYNYRLSIAVEITSYMGKYLIKMELLLKEIPCIYDSHIENALNSILIYYSKTYFVSIQPLP